MKIPNVIPMFSAWLRKLFLSIVKSFCRVAIGIANTYPLTTDLPEATFLLLVLNPKVFFPKTKHIVFPKKKGFFFLTKTPFLSSSRRVRAYDRRNVRVRQKCIRAYDRNPARAYDLTLYTKPVYQIPFLWRNFYIDVLAYNFCERLA